jgi:hypothetical protein
MGVVAHMESLTSVSFRSGQNFDLTAVIERFFSLVKANTSEKQGSEIDDKLGARCMGLYNEQE